MVFWMPENNNVLNSCKLGMKMHQNNNKDFTIAIMMRRQMNSIICLECEVSLQMNVLIEYIDLTIL